MTLCLTIRDNVSANSVILVKDLMQLVFKGKRAFDNNR